MNDRYLKQAVVYTYDPLGQSRTQGKKDSSYETHINMLRWIQYTRRNELAKKIKQLKAKGTSRTKLKAIIVEEKLLLERILLTPIQALTWCLTQFLATDQLQNAMTCADKLAPYIVSKAPIRVESEVNTTSGKTIDEELEQLTADLDYITKQP